MMNHNDDYESGNSYDYIDYAMEDIKNRNSHSPCVDEYDPFSDPSTKEIGNTIYRVTLSCQGKEPFLEKLKRILFDDPLSFQPQNEVKT